MTRFSKSLMSVVLSAIIGVATVLAGVAQANVQKPILPSDTFSFPPQYLDWAPGDEWVAFIFYRHPVCVPSGFDIFDIFDFPVAFGCTPLTVEGFAIFKNADDLAPRQSKLNGLGDVPVWFISRADYDALKTNGLFFDEIRNASSLIQGYATHYKETRHVLGAHPVPKVNTVAKGPVMSGNVYQSFKLHVLALPTKGIFKADIVLE